MFTIASQIKPDLEAFKRVQLDQLTFSGFLMQNSLTGLHAVPVTSWPVSSRSFDGGSGGDVQAQSPAVLPKTS